MIIFIIFHEKCYELNVSSQELNYEIYGSTIYQLVNIKKVEHSQSAVYTLVDIRKVNKKSFSLQLDCDLLSLRFSKKTHNLERLEIVKNKRNLKL